MTTYYINVDKDADGHYRPTDISQNVDDFLSFEYVDAVNQEWQIWEYPSGKIYTIKPDKEFAEDSSEYHSHPGENTWQPQLVEVGVDKKKVAEAFERLSAAATQKPSWLGRLFRPRQSNQTVPEHESGLRDVLRDTGQADYESIKGFQTAKADKDGYFIMEGDYGGQVYLTAPMKQVFCDEAALHKLLQEVDSLGWKDPVGAKLYYERISNERDIPGGMDGGLATDKLWVHKELENKRDRIEAYLAGKTSTILD